MLRFTPTKKSIYRIPYSCFSNISAEHKKNLTVFITLFIQKTYISMTYKTDPITKKLQAPLFLAEIISSAVALKNQGPHLIKNFCFLKAFHHVHYGTTQLVSLNFPDTQEERSDHSVPVLTNRRNANLRFRVCNLCKVTRG
jgi:hypothetical protein